MEDSNRTEGDILRQTQRDIFMRLFPVVVCVAVLGAVGIIGNILAMIFYTTQSKRSTTVNLIIFLSLLDFIACVMIIPKLVEMIINVGYSQRFLCKLTQFASLWSVASSCFLLWIISIDRYRKICKPFAKQITVPAVKYIVISIIIFSLFLSVRNFVNFDIVAVEIPTASVNRTIYGYYCTVTDDPNLKFSISSFYALDFLLILMIWITIIVTYSNAIYTLLKQKRIMKRKLPKTLPDINCELVVGKTTYDERTSTHSSRSNGDSRTCFGSGRKYNLSSGEDIESSHGNDDDNTEDTSKPLSELNEEASGRKSIRKQKDIRKSHIRGIPMKSVLERNLTVMMFTASMIFILCFTPFFAIRITMRLHHGHVLDYELKTGIQFALKLPFINSVFNPVIYSIFNPKFRKFIKRIFCWYC